MKLLRASLTTSVKVTNPLVASAVSVLPFFDKSGTSIISDPEKDQFSPVIYLNPFRVEQIFSTFPNGISNDNPSKEELEKIGRPLTNMCMTSSNIVEPVPFVIEKEEQEVLKRIETIHNDPGDFVPSGFMKIHPVGTEHGVYMNKMEIVSICYIPPGADLTGDGKNIDKPYCSVIMSNVNIMMEGDDSSVLKELGLSWAEL